MEPKRHYIGWNEVHNLVDILHQNLTESNLKFNSIYGFPRGGLIPAVILSHKMGIPLIPILPHLNPHDTPTSNILVVDDICDSGVTLKDIQYPTAVIHYKPHTSITKPDFYAVKYRLNNWVVYPWESKDSKTIQDYKI